jgi:hypothetical protein
VKLVIRSWEVYIRGGLRGLTQVHSSPIEQMVEALAAIEAELRSPSELEVLIKFQEAKLQQYNMAITAAVSERPGTG